MEQLIKKTHPQWHAILRQAMSTVDQNYLQHLAADNTWLPGQASLLAAFSLPLDHTKFILLGESPYPRAQSANGFAFWDNAVGDLWSATGLSKTVNRATSLRNIIKMLLHARGNLIENFSQQAIADLDKTAYWSTAAEFFTNMVKKGFLLLNASLVYSEKKVNYHAKQWQPFINSVFKQLASVKPEIKFILLGQIAAQVEAVKIFPYLMAEHPYNLSFITNSHVLSFFRPLDLLGRYDSINA